MIGEALRWRYVPAVVTALGMMAHLAMLPLLAASGTIWQKGDCANGVVGGGGSRSIRIFCIISRIS